MLLIEHNAATTDPTGAHVAMQSTQRGKKVLTLVATLCLGSAGIGAGVAAVVVGGSAPADPTSHAASTASSRGSEVAAVTINVAKVAAEVTPAVVDINTTLDALEGGGAAAGTGMIVSPGGEIITNNHVVQGADTVNVSISGHGRQSATLIGTDPSADVAVLQVGANSKLPVVQFGNSSDIQVGDPVVALGNALGLGGSPTVTNGIISATGRTITASDETGSNSETLRGLLQTDAPIAPGNSGGPLVNASAKVIGMDTAAASSGTVGASLGFAIPSNTVRLVAGEIVAHKNLPGLVFSRAPFLGVEVVDSSETGSGVDPYGSFGNPFGFGYGVGPIETTPNGTPGVVVAAVDPKSGAANAGIQSGDVITKADGQATPTTTALSKIVNAHKPGQVVSLTVTTASGTKTVDVTLGKGPID